VLATAQSASSTNLRFGNGSTLLYSTAHILTYMCMDDTDVLVVYGDAGSTVELAFATGSSAAVSGGLHMQTALSTGNATLNFVISAGIQSIMLTSHGRTPIRVIVADYVSATTMWQPSVSGTGALAAYVDVAATTPVLVAGPYLVRTAALAHGTLALTGDTNATTPLTVLGPASVAAVTWNGNHVATRRSALGALVGSIAGPAEQVQLPDLMRLAWRAADSLPEITSGYNDAKWTAADHTTSTSVFPRFYGGPWWLNAADYGYYVRSRLRTRSASVSLAVRSATSYGAGTSLAPRRRLSTSRLVAAQTSPRPPGSTACSSARPAPVTSRTRSRLTISRSRSLRARCTRVRKMSSRCYRTTWDSIWRVCSCAAHQVVGSAIFSRRAGSR
jgi:hypothetical protein